MRNNKKRFVFSALALSLMIGVVSVQGATVTPGGTINTSLSCGVMTGKVNVTATNATVLSSGNWCEKGKSISVSVKAGNSGNATINLIGEEVTNEDEMTEHKGILISSVSYTIVTPTPPGNNSGNNGGSNTSKPPVNNNVTPSENEFTHDTKSSDNLLSSLTLTKGTLSPEFHPDVLEYTVSLEAGTTATSVSAQAKDAKSTIEGTGDITLVEGDNLIEVKVTAENGDLRTYKIYVYVDEKNMIVIKHDKLNYGIVTKVDRVEAPAGFEKVTIKVNGKEVPAWKQIDANMTLLYLRDENGAKNFYLYDEKTGEIISMYQPVTIAGKEMIVLSVSKAEQKRSGMKYSTKIKIGELNVTGWEYEDKAYENYVMLYLMNHKGQKHYYLYEKTEGTLQIAPDMANVSQKEYDTLQTEAESLRVWKIGGLVGTIGFGILAAMGFYFNRVNKKRYLAHRRRLYEAENEKN